MPDQTDEMLMQRVVNGDAAAVADLYDRYGRVAFGLAYRILGDAAGAEEAVQDAFLQVWRKASSFDPDKGAGFRAWLLTMVHHRSIDLLRSSNRHDSRQTELQPDAPLASDADPLADVLATLDGEQVRTAMAGLPDEQRQAIELAYFEGLTQQEIADRTGIALGTIKGRIRLGLTKLHTALLDASGPFEQVSNKRAQR